MYRKTSNRQTSSWKQVLTATDDTGTSVLTITRRHVSENKLRLSASVEILKRLHFQLTASKSNTANKTQIIPFHTRESIISMT